MKSLKAAAATAVLLLCLPINKGAIAREGTLTDMVAAFMVHGICLAEEGIFDAETAKEIAFGALKDYTTKNNIGWGRIKNILESDTFSKRVRNTINSTGCGSIVNDLDIPSNLR